MQTPTDPQALAEPQARMDPQVRTDPQAPAEPQALAEPQVRMDSQVRLEPQVRTEPQQRRSREKRDRVLAAAAGLLQEVPFEEIGTKLIADRADVSVGSLYRFFPDRDAIFTALLASWLDKLVELMDEQVADPPPTAAAFVDRLVEVYARFWRAEPGYRQVAVGGPALLPPRGVGRHNDNELTERVFRVFTEHYRLPAGPDLRPRLVLAVNVTEFLLNQAFRVAPEGDQQVLDELKLLLRRYLAVG